MFCKSCNTQLTATNRHCPACGRATHGSPDSSSSGLEDASLPPLPPAEHTPEDDTVDPLEMVLDEEIEAPARTSPPARKAVARPRATASALFTLEPVELRAQICGQPELLEPGLQALRDAQGRPMGVAYVSEVGEIDLLAEDADGALVVVLVPEREQAEQTVAAVLERMGWVSKHLGKGERPVRGIVLLDPSSMDLGYAARAVRNTVSFKTYRVALTIDDCQL